ncbi:26s proteasome non-atpase regulatory subunit 5-related [Holotrichia oblita]|uniref:26s proteasome non-atpase regulatory subunit 5-related n=1 Tax=Holotrichia oblita TaxID=644536 RepID=A0ACB9SUB3_HOLOL|nr:26s proteasome non-atpase regulatory subunit 5-related [Holotrichia oblita]
MSREQWLSQKSSALVDEDERMSTLNEIKDYLTSLPQDEAAQSAQLLQMPLLFDCLNDSNTEQIDLACEVLALCLGTLNLGESTNRFTVPLERALKHPHSQVKIMALKDIQRNIVNDELLVNFCKHTSLLSMAIECIGSDDLAVATLACDIITTIGVSESCIKTLLSKDIQAVLTDVMNKNEVVRLLIFEVFINISRKSETSQNLLESSGFLSQILDDLDNNDILLRMNIIELLSQLVTCEQGYQYLERNGVMAKFCKQLGNEDALFIQLCEPGVLKFFGQLAYWKPNDIVTKYVLILNRICSNIDSDNFTLVGISIETVGHIAETNEGKIALNSLADIMSKLLPSIVEKLNKLPNELKIRALNCLENIIQVNTNDARVMAITKKWYTCLEGNPIEFILRYAKNPIAEIRSAGLGILNALASQFWGQEVIKNAPGLLEFLLDRNIETIKECRELKFEIVKKLSTSEVFNHEVNLRLQAFVKEGAFYVEGITEVAIEGNE